MASMSYTGQTEGAECDVWLRHNCHKKKLVVPIEPSVVSTIIYAYFEYLPANLPHQTLAVSPAPATLVLPIMVIPFQVSVCFEYVTA